VTGTAVGAVVGTAVGTVVGAVVAARSILPDRPRRSRTDLPL
jgi:gas vesicle protein